MSSREKRFCLLCNIKKHIMNSRMLSIICPSEEPFKGTRMRSGTHPPKEVLNSRVNSSSTCRLFIPSRLDEVMNVHSAIPLALGYV